ncbi:MAG: hypothetical protein ACRD8Z_04685, partial [Nitrososphaeraceae archaeon]
MTNTNSRMSILCVSIPFLAIAIFAVFFESFSAFAQAQTDNGVANTSSENISNVEMNNEGKSVTYFDNVSGYLATPQSNIST